MLELYIKGLQLYAFHGVGAEERAVGHRYIVSLWMQVESGAETSDRVEDTVDYGAVAQLCSDFLTTRQFRTLEYAATQLCGRILDQFPRIAELKLSLGKMLPPIPFVAEEAGVIVTRTKGRRMVNSE